MTLLSTLSRFAGFGVSFKTTPQDIASLARQRRALSQLSDEQLQDIGITRLEATQEARRPLWDAPSTWWN